jgi:L-fuculose-phosphate aldolase
MENHGVVTCADNLFDAFKIFETLERCAELNIVAKQLGEATVLSDEDIELNQEKGKILPREFVPIEITSQEKKVRKEMCALIHRAYDQNLFTSTMGTFSQRLDKDNFLITPYGIDRKYLEPDEIVLMKQGLREKGKHPSRSANLHKLIYDQHPDVNAIVIAHPTNMMAFGITRTPIDPRTIPESYLMIRDLVRGPYGLSIVNPQAIVDRISPSTPVILAENDFVLTVGSTLINAFDRLEVAEFTAETIINAAKIGKIDPISQERIDQIDQAFHLK